MTPKTRSLLLAILFLAGLWGITEYLNRSEPSRVALDPRSNGGTEERHESHDARSIERHRVSEEIGFPSREKLIQHYEKHGREFGSISMEEYLRQAQHLRDRPPGGDVLEYIRPDGIASRYDRGVGTFIAFNPDTTLRTCFKPNDGEDYFQRQKTKQH